jgi:hypothetical protein
MPLRAELRCASIPFIGALADHYWFVVWDDQGRCERWEVWQRKRAGGTSFGHVHCNLKHPDAGVGGGKMRVMAEWQGDPASRLHEVLRTTASSYPHSNRYRPWPGPNSNTFVAWVLRQAGIGIRLPWKAIGKGYRWPGV